MEDFKHFKNRRLVMSKDLNGAHKLFGGTILAWMDEQAYIEVRTLLKSDNVVTKNISNVEFLSGAGVGDIVEIDTEIVKVGKSSITLQISVNNISTNKPIANMAEIVMVNVDENNKPIPHNFTHKK